MKIHKSIFLFFLCLLITKTYGQRYLTKTFDSVSVMYDINYGWNLTFKGDTQQLLLDLYMPFGDTVAKRPLVVLAHGGSFATGNRRASDIVTLCKRLSAMGYVTASIEYRLGADILSGRPLEEEFQNATWRATQDNKAAIRFFRKSMTTGNPYKLDSSKFYGGGISAGAAMAMQMCFLDKPAELANTTIDTTLVGGMEGKSGNPGYDWHLKGIINLCGALGRTQWMNDNRNVSLCNMHGNWDATVPYKTDYYKFLGSNVTIVQGSFSIDSAARAMGMDTRFYTFDQAGHVPFTGTTAAQLAYMDTTVDYVARYLYRHVTGKIPSGTYEPIGIKQQIIVFPNPAKDFITVGFTEDTEASIILFNAEGKEMERDNGVFLNKEIPLRGQETGLYFLQVVTGKDNRFFKVTHE